MTLTLPLTLLACHFLGDFILQSDWMAINKSKNPKALGLHCLVYALCFSWLGLLFFAATFLSHFLTDAVTSRITTRLWFFKDMGGSCDSKGTHYYAPVVGNRHYFFVVIGLDQLIHYMTLALTLRFL